jgi:hypothetical protein
VLFVCSTYQYNCKIVDEVEWKVFATPAYETAQTKECDKVVMPLIRLDRVDGVVDEIKKIISIRLTHLLNTDQQQNMLFQAIRPLRVISMTSDSILDEQHRLLVLNFTEFIWDNSTESYKLFDTKQFNLDFPLNGNYGAGQDPLLVQQAYDKMKNNLCKDVIYYLRNLKTENKAVDSLMLCYDQLQESRVFASIGCISGLLFGNEEGPPVLPTQDVQQLVHATDAFKKAQWQTLIEAWNGIVTQAQSPMTIENALDVSHNVPSLNGIVPMVVRSMAWKGLTSDSCAIFELWSVLRVASQ